MTLPPLPALLVVVALALLSVGRFLVAIRERRVAWGPVRTLVVDRRTTPGAYWFSVGLFLFAFFAFSFIAIDLARTLLAGA